MERPSMLNFCKHASVVVGKSSRSEAGMTGAMLMGAGRTFFVSTSSALLCNPAGMKNLMPAAIN